jgi:hypothetical protein
VPFTSKEYWTKRHVILQSSCSFGCICRQSFKKTQFFDRIINNSNFLGVPQISVYYECITNGHLIIVHFRVLEEESYLLWPNQPAASLSVYFPVPPMRIHFHLYYFIHQFNTFLQHYMPFSLQSHVRQYGGLAKACRKDAWS